MTSIWVMAGRSWHISTASPDINTLGPSRAIFWGDTWTLKTYLKLKHLPRRYLFIWMSRQQWHLSKKNLSHPTSPLHFWTCNDTQQSLNLLRCSPRIFGEKMDDWNSLMTGGKQFFARSNVEYSIYIYTYLLSYCIYYFSIAGTS